jgi:hypothetical protein
LYANNRVAKIPFVGFFQIKILASLCGSFAFRSFGIRVISFRGVRVKYNDSVQTKFEKKYLLLPCFAEFGWSGHCKKVLG